jgi:hypothetical protein
MTTEALRKVIKVTYWMLGEKGISISYEREDSTPSSLHLILSPADSVRELTVIGSIDSAEYYGGNNIVINYNEGSCRWEGFLGIFKLCQFEALQIAILHEAMKDLDNDIDMLEMDSALNALKQDQD